MKNKISKLALLLAMLAAGNSAMAQTVITLLPNRAYTFTGTAASGTGTLTYQWYRNGVAISGATSQNYTMPAANAGGAGVEIKRGTMSSSCSGQVTYSNIYNVSFCGLVVSSTCWARENTTGGNAFASKPDEYTPFFQWNRTTAWASTGSISGWNSTADQSMTWTNNPCPSGWQLPTESEFYSLLIAGRTWVAANARGNAVAGCFYGPSHASCTISNLEGCVFLPAVGIRDNSNGLLNNQGSNGAYWINQSNTNYGYCLTFSSSSNTTSLGNFKASGVSVRCVAQ